MALKALALARLNREQIWATSDGVLHRPTRADIIVSIHGIAVVS